MWWAILPDRRIYWIASQVSRAWTVCILMPWNQESFVWLDRFRHSGRATARQTQTMSTADIFRVLATWAWRPLQITSEKKVSRYRLECQSVRTGSIITIQKKLLRHCRWCRYFNPTWGAVGDLGQCQRRKRSETIRQSHIYSLGLCLVHRRKKSQSQRLPSLTVISVTRCKRSRPPYDRPDVCSTFVRCDTNVARTVRRGPLLRECAVVVSRPNNRSSWWCECVLCNPLAKVRLYVI